MPLRVYDRFTRTSFYSGGLAVPGPELWIDAGRVARIEKAYNIKDSLKAAGFRFNGRAWEKESRTHEDVIATLKTLADLDVAFEDYDGNAPVLAGVEMKFFAVAQDLPSRWIEISREEYIARLEKCNR